MKILRVPIGKVVPWPDNPRIASDEGIERLKKQIVKLGIYKPLLAYEDGDRYVVVGGCQRLRAYRELGHKEVELVVVKARTQGQILKVSISDNDRAGYYDPQQLTELVYEQKEAIDLGLFRIDLGVDVSLADVLATRGKPVAQTEVYGSDRKEGPGPLICPNCGAVVEEGDGS